MKKMKKIFKRCVSLVLSLIIISTVGTCALSTAASADGSVRLDWDWIDKYNLKKFKTTDGKLCYCIEYKTQSDKGSHTKVNVKDTKAWTNLSSRAKDGITYATIYGYGGKAYESAGGGSDAAYYATQLIIWEYEKGKRSNANSLEFTELSTDRGYLDGNVKKEYKAILNRIKAHKSRPNLTGSGVNETRSGEWNIKLKIGSNNEISVTDKNGVLSKFKLATDNSDYKITQNGNTLKIYAKKAFSGVKSVSRDKIGTSGNANLALTKPGYQTVCYGGIDDPVPIKLNFEIATGSLEIKKTATCAGGAELSDKSIFSFKVTGPNGYNKTVKTNASGYVKLDGLIIGDYKIEEVNVPAGWEWWIPDSKTISVTAGQTSTANFENVENSGRLDIIKSADGRKSGNLQGFKFKITSDKGYNQTVTTKNNGRIVLSDIPIAKYTIEEIEVPAEYKKPAKQTVDLSKNNIVTVKFHNEYNNIKIVKEDEFGNLIDGVTFWVYKDQSCTSLATHGTTAEPIELTTNGDGYALLTGDILAELDENHIYYVREEKIDTDKYPTMVLDQTPQKLDLKNTTSLKFVNKYKPGIIISKSAEDGGYVAKDNSGNRYLDFKFRFKLIKALNDKDKSKEGKEYYCSTNKNGVFNGERSLIEGTYLMYEDAQQSDTYERYKTENYVMMEPRKIEVRYDSVLNFAVENKLKRGNVKLTKKSDNGESAGFEFLLYGTSSAGTDVYETRTTDASGAAMFENIPIGTYKLKELTDKVYFQKPGEKEVTVECAEGFEWNEEYEISLPEYKSKTSNVTFENKLKRGGVEIEKTSEDGKIEGIEFRLTGRATCGMEIDMSAKTDKNGHAFFENVPIGDNYKIEEVATGIMQKKYIIPDAQYVSVTSNNLSFAKFENKLANGILQITKDSEDGLIKGIHFTVVSSLGQSFEAVTNDEGFAEIRNLRVYDDNGNKITYTVKEKDVAIRYIEPDEQSVELNTDSTSELKFYNRLKKGKITISKTADDNVIEGVTFKIISSIGKDYTVATDKNGVAVFEDLQVYDTDGNKITYVISEVGTPKRYELVPEITVEIDRDEDKNVPVHNKIPKGSIEIQKTSEDGKNEGITFTVTSSLGQSWEIKTDANGIAGLDGLQVFDDNGDKITYTVNEKDVADYYIKPSQQITVLAKDSTSKLEFENKLKRGSVKVTKISEDGKIEGVKFSLTGTSDSGEEVSLTAVTDKNGIAVFDNVLIGTYTVEEVDTAEWYITPDKQTVTVAYDNTADLTIENKLKRGSVKVTKISEDGKIEGVKFSLTGTSDSGEVVNLTAVTDKTGIAVFDNVLIGTYTIEEVDVAEWYITPDKQTVTVVYDSTSDNSVTNTLKRGYIEWQKTSTEDGTSLEGAVYGIFDKDGNLIYKAITDKNGYARSCELVWGEYYLQEMTAPEHYHLDYSAHKFNITGNETHDKPLEMGVADAPIVGSIIGKVYTEPPVERYDGEEHIEINPQTGAERLSDVTAGLMLLSALAVAVTKKRKGKKEKENEKI